MRIHSTIWGPLVALARQVLESPAFERILREAATSQVARDLINNQKFVRFVNTHMAFVRVAWPKDDDTSLEALEFLAWAHRQNAGMSAKPPIWR